MEFGSLGALASIGFSALTAVSTYAVLQHRVKVLEKAHETALQKSDARDAAMNAVLVTLSRVETKLDHLSSRPWWKG